MAKRTPGQRLKEELKARNLTQRSAAEALGITDAYLGQIILGRETPGLKLAVKIQELYKVPCEDFARVA